MSAPPDVAAFRAGLATGALPPGLRARDPAETARRFAVYRNNVAHSLTEALAARVPVVRRLVGEAFFAAMAREFLAVHPPSSPVLLRWGAALPGFLDGFAPVAGLPYLGDVARIEVARGVAYHAADRTPVAPADLPARLAEGRVALHPGLGVVASRHPALSIWRANQPGADGVLRAAGPETALVLRNLALDVEVHAIGAADLSVLGMLGLDLDPGAARAAGGADLGSAALLTLLARAGALIQPEATP